MKKNMKTKYIEFTCYFRLTVYLKNDIFIFIVYSCNVRTKLCGV